MLADQVTEKPPITHTAEIFGPEACPAQRPTHATKSSTEDNTIAAEKEDASSSFGRIRIGEAGGSPAETD
jgi:hypothetical protein